MDLMMVDISHEGAVYVFKRKRRNPIMVSVKYILISFLCGKGYFVSIDNGRNN